MPAFRRLKTLLGLGPRPTTPAGVGEPVNADPFEDGVAAANADDFATALRLWRPLAEHGLAAAQNNLGELLETGRGVSREPVQALGWYRKSAESGFAPAQFNLARLFAFGIGTERDAAAAREWATRAQGQGIAQAAELLNLIADAEKSR